MATKKYNNCNKQQLHNQNSALNVWPMLQKPKKNQKPTIEYE